MSEDFNNKLSNSTQEQQMLTGKNPEPLKGPEVNKLPREVGARAEKNLGETKNLGQQLKDWFANHKIFTLSVLGLVVVGTSGLFINSDNLQAKALESIEQNNGEIGSGVQDSIEQTNPDVNREVYNGTNPIKYSDGAKFHPPAP